MTRKCGECSLCCKLLDVPGVSPAGTQCQFASSCGKGCTIYQTRPPVCRTFDCLWLESHALPDELRPDRCGVMFEAYHQERLVIVMADVPGAWRKEAPMALIGQILHDGYAVWVLDGKDRHMMIPEGDTSERVMERTKAAWRRKHVGA